MIDIITDENQVLDLINSQSEEDRAMILKTIDTHDKDVYIHFDQKGNHTFVLKFSRPNDSGLSIVHTNSIGELSEFLKVYDGLEELKEYLVSLKLD